MQEVQTLLANIQQAQETIRAWVARLQELAFAPNLGGGLGALPAPGAEPVDREVRANQQGQPMAEELQEDEEGEEQ